MCKRGVKGGLRLPNPPVLRPPMLATKKKHDVISMFAVREGCADDFVSKWGVGCDPHNSPLFENHPCL